MMEKDGNVPDSILDDGAAEYPDGDAVGYESLGDSNKENENRLDDDIYEDDRDYVDMVEGEMARRGTGMGM